MHAIACLRHVYAVHKVALAIRQGASGECLPLHRTHKGSTGSASRVMLTLFLLSQLGYAPSRMSKPDVCLVSHHNYQHLTGCPAGPVDPAERSHHFSHLSCRRPSRQTQSCITVLWTSLNSIANLRQSLLQSRPGDCHSAAFHVGTEPARFSHCPLTDCKSQCGVEHRMRLAQPLTDLYYAANKYPLNVLSARHRATRQLLHEITLTEWAYDKYESRVFTTTTHTCCHPTFSTVHQLSTTCSNHCVPILEFPSIC